MASETERMRQARLAALMSRGVVDAEGKAVLNQNDEAESFVLDDAASDRGDVLTHVSDTDLEADDTVSATTDRENEEDDEEKEAPAEFEEWVDPPDRGYDAMCQFFRYTPPAATEHQQHFFLYEDVADACRSLGFEFPGCTNIGDADSISLQPIRDLVQEGRVIMEFVSLGTPDQFIRCWDIAALATYVATNVVVCREPTHPFTRAPLSMDDIALIGLAFAVLFCADRDYAMSHDDVRVADIRQLENTNRIMRAKWCEWLELCEIDAARARTIQARVTQALQHPYEFFTSFMGRAQPMPRDFPRSLQSVKPFGDMINKQNYFETLTSNVSRYMTDLRRRSSEADPGNSSERATQRRRIGQMKSYGRRRTRHRKNIQESKA